MGETRPEIKLSNETGEETRKAVNRYREEKGTHSQEGVIRRLLPRWTFEGRDDPHPGIPGRPLPDIEYRDTPIDEWEYIDKVADGSEAVGSVRLYYEPHEGVAGFQFMAVIVEAILDQATPFTDENTRVSVLMHGRVVWDEFKTIRFGSSYTDNRGYFTGEIFNEFREVFTELEQLKDEYCRPKPTTRKQD